MKKLALVLMAMGLAVGSVSAALPAMDNASNYGGTWNTGSNGGTGFGAWTINDGDGGHYIGATGLGSNTFGLFNTFTSTTTDAIRPFTGALSPGQTFSINLGFSPFNSGGGAVGIDLMSGTNVSIELVTTGSGDWMLNDGGSNFSAGVAAASNTPFSFSFTYNGGNSYSFTLTGSVGGTNFMSANSISGIDNLRIFNFNQGPGANFGFDNLAIVPEPSSLALVAGPALLGAWFFFRRRRSA